MEYTKGEWRLKPAVIGHPHFNIMDSKETSVIAHIPSQLEEFEANARLIAAAPDLYEACKFAEYMLWEGLYRFKQERNKAQELLSKALAKVEGK